MKICKMFFTLIVIINIIFTTYIYSFSETISSLSPNTAFNIEIEKVYKDDSVEFILRIKNGNKFVVFDYTSPSGHDGRQILNYSWTDNSKYFIYSTSSSGGHSADHFPTSIISLDDYKCFLIDDCGIYVTNPKFELYDNHIKLNCYHANQMGIEVIVDYNLDNLLSTLLNTQSNDYSNVNTINKAQIHNVDIESIFKKTLNKNIDLTFQNMKTKYSNLVHKNSRFVPGIETFELIDMISIIDNVDINITYQFSDRNKNGCQGLILSIKGNNLTVFNEEYVNNIRDFFVSRIRLNFIKKIYEENNYMKHYAFICEYEEPNIFGSTSKSTIMSIGYGYKTLNEVSFEIGIFMSTDVIRKVKNALNI